MACVIYGCNNIPNNRASCPIKLANSSPSLSTNHSVALLKNAPCKYQKRTRDLHTFAKDGNITSAQGYLNKLDLKKREDEVYFMRDEKGDTPFIIAAKEGHGPFLQYLLKEVEAPIDLLKNTIDWGKTNEGTRKNKVTFLKKDILNILKKSYKPFKCKEPNCLKNFASSSDLDKHTRIHTGEKPYKCSHCSYAAAQNIALNTHIMTHTGEKPYKCLYCDYRTTTSSHLNRHQKNHIFSSSDHPLSLNQPVNVTNDQATSSGYSLKKHKSNTK